MGGALRRLRALQNPSSAVTAPVEPKPVTGASPPSAIERKVAMKHAARKEADGVPEYAEVRRILNLPMSEDVVGEDLEQFCKVRLLAEAYESGFRLHPNQARAIRDFEAEKGLIAPIGVGWGKTLITLALAQTAFRSYNHSRILLTVPPQVYRQLIDHDISWARRKIPLSVPFIPMGQTSASRRMALATSGRNGCYILPYSCLQTKDTSRLLEEIAPTVVILDEAHWVRHLSAARTKRLLGIIDKLKAKVAALSGTFTAKSIMDYHHLAWRALGQGCPVPVSVQMATEWANVLDSDAGDARGATGPLEPLIEWARQKFPKEQLESTRAGFRRGFRLRLTSTPGVVSTGDNEIGTSLVLMNRPAFPVKSNGKDDLLLEFANGDELSRLMRKVNDEWVTPNGDEIEHAIHCYKWLYELTLGFYNQLTWPTDEALAERKSISPAEAQDQLMRARIYHAAQQHYHKELRGWLKEKSRSGMDTPMLVGKDMFRHQDANVGEDLYRAWIEMRDLDFPGRPERDKKAVRVCDYKIAAMAQWAKELPKDKGALVWVYHHEVGDWAVEYLRNAGLNVLHCPAGPKYDQAIRDPANANKIVVASMTAHGTGKNLQTFQETYFLQWPRSAQMAEQTLGRNHRMGQQAESLQMATNNTLLFDELVFAACAEDSLYIHATTGNRQKLMYCAFDPMPRMFSSEILAERGLQPHTLSAPQRALLEDKFGKILETVPNT